jgi:ferrochelatase
VPEAFLHAGGEHFGYIPCLNENDEWINALMQLSLTHLGNWLTDAQSDPAILSLPADRGQKLGADN